MDSASAFADILGRAYSRDIRDAVARELGLQPSTGQPLERHLILQAIAMAEASRQALLGVDWATAFPEAHAAGGFDVVVGNPPFLNRLETLTATSPEVAARLDEVSGGALRP